MFLDSTTPDADIPAPLGETEREDITAEIDVATPFAPESEGWTPLDCMAARRRRLRQMKEIEHWSHQSDVAPYPINRPISLQHLKYRFLSVRFNVVGKVLQLSKA